MLVINLKAKLHWTKLYAPTYNVYSQRTKKYFPQQDTNYELN